MVEKFDETTIRNIADIIAYAISHKQINELLNNTGIKDAQQGTNKSDKVYYSLKNRQIQDKCANNLLLFVQKFISPKRYDDESLFENHRALINEKLLYEGIEISKEGIGNKVNKAKTVSEAKERSIKIKQKIGGLNIHGEVIRFCEAEWLKENYFHAILEITKSVAQKLRDLSGYFSDGNELVSECFGLGTDKKPMLALNTLQTPSEESEHKGLANFVKGFFSMYRNPKAHNPKILEETQLNEMTEVLIIASIIYRKLEKTFKTGFK